MKAKVKPLRNEKYPRYPITFWTPPWYATRYEVKDDDTWGSVAEKFTVQPGQYFKGNSAQYLIWFNFGTINTDEVNYYLRVFVGCNVSKDGGNNWAFSDSADPGVIYIPPKLIDAQEGEALDVNGNRGLKEKGIITVPEYDDRNFLDTLSKALDIFQMVELAGTLELTLPMLVQGGLIGVGALAGVIGPAVAVGAPHAEALRATSRKHFFDGFSLGLVASANGAWESYIREHYELKYPPLNSVYPEKRETFRKLHNGGLTLGIRKGKQMNLAEKEKFFIYLHSQLRGADREYFSSGGRWKDWSEKKRKDYYDIFSGIVKNAMLSNNLQLKIK